MTASPPEETVLPGVWIIVPAYNEGERLDSTLQSLKRFQPNVIVIDDGSSDSTSTVALTHDVWVLRHLINRGQGAALQTGIEFALQQGAEILVTFDADGQHLATEIDRVIEPIRTGQADVVLGSRFLGQSPDIPWARWFLLKLAVAFTRLSSGLCVTDAHNGFRALSRAAASRIVLTQDRMAHASEVLDQIRLHRLRFCEVPVTVRYSNATLGKGQSAWDAFAILVDYFLGRDKA